MNSVHEPHPHNSNPPIHIDLQMNLLNMWTKFKVPQYYQHIFLAHIEEHSQQKAQQIIKKQIRLTMEKKSPYFQLERHDQERKKIITKIKSQLKSLPDVKNMNELSSLCKDLKELRQANLQTGQFIIKMYHTYHCNNIDSADRQMQYYDIMFDNLDRDNNFLKESQLNKYIVFDEGYDPFLMSSYQHVHRNKMKNLSEPVKDFYTLNISYAYRLMKTKNIILELRSLVNPLMRQDSRKQSLSYSQIFEESHNEHPPRNQRRRKKSSQMDTQRLQTEKPRKIKPIQVFPAPGMKSRTTIYKDKPSSASITEFNEPIKLKFQKLGKVNDSRTQFKYDSAPSKNYPQDKHLKTEGNEEFTRFQIKPKRSLSNQLDNDKELSQIKAKKSLPYQVDLYDNSARNKQKVGEIYQVYDKKLLPIRHQRVSTEGSKESNRYDPDTLDINNKSRNQSESVPSLNYSGIKLSPLGKTIEKQQKNDEQEEEPPRQYEQVKKEKKVTHYNPITGNQYSLRKTGMKHKRYDFNPRKLDRKILIKKYQQNGDQDQHQGLVYQTPISKYNIKSYKKNKKSQQKSPNSEFQSKGDFSEQYTTPQKQEKQRKNAQYQGQIRPNQRRNQTGSNQNTNQNKEKYQQGGRNQDFERGRAKGENYDFDEDTEEERERKKRKFGRKQYEEYKARLEEQSKAASKNHRNISNQDRSYSNDDEKDPKNPRNMSNQGDNKDPKNNPYANERYNRYRENEREQLHPSEYEKGGYNRSDQYENGPQSSSSPHQYQSYKNRNQPYEKQEHRDRHNQQNPGGNQPYQHSDPNKKRPFDGNYQRNYGNPDKNHQYANLQSNDDRNPQPNTSYGNPDNHGNRNPEHNNKYGNPQQNNLSGNPHHNNNSSFRGEQINFGREPKSQNNPSTYSNSHQQDPRQRNHELNPHQNEPSQHQQYNQSHSGNQPRQQYEGNNNPSYPTRNEHERTNNLGTGFDNKRQNQQGPYRNQQQGNPQRYPSSSSSKHNPDQFLPEQRSNPQQNVGNRERDPNLQGKSQYNPNQNTYQQQNPQNRQQFEPNLANSNRYNQNYPGEQRYSQQNPSINRQNQSIPQRYPENLKNQSYQPHENQLSSTGTHPKETNPSFQNTSNRSQGEFQRSPNYPNNNEKIGAYQGDLQGNPNSNQNRGSQEQFSRQPNNFQNNPQGQNTNQQNIQSRRQPEYQAQRTRERQPTFGSGKPNSIQNPNQQAQFPVNSSEHNPQQNNIQGQNNNNNASSNPYQKEKQREQSQRDENNPGTPSFDQRQQFNSGHPYQRNEPDPYHEPSFYSPPQENYPQNSSSYQQPPSFGGNGQPSHSHQTLSNQPSSNPSLVSASNPNPSSNPQQGQNIADKNQQHSSRPANSQPVGSNQSNVVQNPRPANQQVNPPPNISQQNQKMMTSASNTNKTEPPKKIEQESSSEEQSSSEQQSSQGGQSSKLPEKQNYQNRNQQTNKNTTHIQQQPINSNIQSSTHNPQPVSSQQSEVKKQAPQVENAQNRNAETQPNQLSTKPQNELNKSELNNGDSLRASTVGGKKQIRMKVCKQKLPTILTLLQQLKVNQNSRHLYDRQKMMAWVKVNQTYLIYFYINEVLGILALCSPIPTVGMMIKLWAPLSQYAQDQKASTTLFKKYIDLIQKSTTYERILYAGAPFPELEKADFKMKKQNLYERQRVLPMKQSNTQFKPFLYIQCSNIRFDNKGDQKLLYSNEIEQFSDKNSFSIDFMGSVKNQVPQNLQPLVKYSSQIQNFKVVNQILTQQQFDNYQASEQVIQNIDLIRMYLNSIVKSTFVAYDAFLKFTGVLLYESGSKYLISLGVMKNNGNIYFAKNMEMEQIMQYSKKPSNKRVFFSVMMFNKKLYGKMMKFPSGCYGCWQINLIWQDQFSGKIIHDMNQKYKFGQDGFTVMIQLEGRMIFGFTVNKNDSII